MTFASTRSASMVCIQCEGIVCAFVGIEAIGEAATGPLGGLEAKQNNGNWDLRELEMSFFYTTRRSFSGKITFCSACASER